MRKPIHKIGHFVKVGWPMIPDVNRLLPITPTQLTNIGDRDVIEGPEGIFIERFDPVFQSDLNANR